MLYSLCIAMVENGLHQFRRVANSVGLQGLVFKPYFTRAYLTNAFYAGVGQKCPSPTLTKNQQS